MMEAVTKMLICYHLQSSKNFFRLYLCFNYESFLLFPIAEGDYHILMKLSFADFKAEIFNRLSNLLAKTGF